MKTTEYGNVINVWLALLSLTVLVIALSSLKMGKAIFIAAVIISLVQAYLIFRVYITKGLIKFSGKERTIANVFVSLGFVLAVISFVLLFI
ncbi:MAG: hypothetical protein AB9882_03950 [Ignavibacteriaceae bacterium]